MTSNGIRASAFSLPKNERKNYMLIRCIAVGAGGFIGSITRYLLSKVELQKSGDYPLNTLLVNVLGAVLIGVIIAETQKNGMSENKLLFLKFGLCGGLTTFSTFSVEMYGYLEKGNVVIAIGYAVVSVALSIILLIFGMNIVFNRFL